MIIVVCTGFAVLLHLVLGWQWTMLAGILCGMMMYRWGGFGGFVSVASGWGILVLINYLAAPEPVGRMLHITGGILGNLPGAAVVVLTLVIGGLIGLIGGLIGIQLARLVPSLRLYRQFTKYKHRNSEGLEV